MNRPSALNQEVFRAIFNSTFQFIGLLDVDGTLLEANETALAFGGIEPEDVIGEPFWEAIWWSFDPEAQAQLKTAVFQAAQGEFVRYDADVRGEDGNVITIDFSLKPVFDPNGNVVWIIPEGRDISEQVKTRQQLERHQFLLAEAQRLARLGNWEWDLRTNEIYWSDEILHIHQLDRQTFGGTYEDFLATVHPDDLDYVRQTIQTAVAAGTNLDYYYRMRRPNGETRIIYGLGQVKKDENGQVVRIAGTAQDVTEARTNAQNLEAMSDKLTKLSEMGQLITSSLAIEEIYQNALTTIQTLVQAEAVLIFQHEKDSLKIVGQIGLPTKRPVGEGIHDTKGVAGEIWQTTKPLLLRGEACQQQMSHQFATMANYHPQVIMGVPLSWRDRRLGVLEALHRQPDAFSDVELKILEMAAAWLAIALYNAQQHTLLQKQLVEREALASVGSMLHNTLELEEVLPLVAKAAQQIIPEADWAAIHLLEGTPQKLHPVATSGLWLAPDAYILDVKEGIAGEALQLGQVVNVPDLQEDVRRLVFDREQRIRALLVAPLQGRTGSLGTLSVQCARPATFSADDERAIKALAAQATLAIENGRLFRSQQRARRLAEHRLKRIRQLTRQAITTEEEERRRVALELHDEAGQSLTALKISLDMLRATLPDEMELLNEGLGEASELTEQTMENIRLLSHNLRPPGLDRFGLDKALDSLCQDFSGRTHLAVTYAGLELPNLPWPIAISLYRCAQEALTNAAKHANAKEINLRLSQTNTLLRLDIHDDGQGFDMDVINPLKPAPLGGIGLSGIAKRLELLDGRLDIYTRPNEGTKLVVQVPLWH